MTSTSAEIQSVAIMVLHSKSLLDMSVLIPQGFLSFSMEADNRENEMGDREMG
jgi:hypothetical protein